MAEYWVKASKSAEAEGPYSADQVRELARAGQLSAESSLVSPNRKKWFPARRVEGLFSIPASIPMATAIAPAMAGDGVPAGFQAEPTSNLLPYASPGRRVAYGPPGSVRSVRWYFIAAIIMTLIVFASFGPGIRQAGAAGLRSLSAPRATVSPRGGQYYGISRRTGTYANVSLSDNPNLLMKFILFLTAGLVVPFASIAMFIYYTCWVYKVHEEMRQYTDGQYPITPGQACGFCWVPFYNLYWMVHMPGVLAREINSYLADKGGKVNASGVMTMSVLAFVPGAFIGGLSLVFRGLTMDMIQKGLNALWLNNDQAINPRSIAGRPIF